MPAPEDHVHYQTALDEDWVPAVAGLHRLMPEWQPWTRTQIAGHSAGDMNWGQVKCKRVDVAKWMAGVTQVVFGAGCHSKAPVPSRSQKMPRARESQRGEVKRCPGQGEVRGDALSPQLRCSCGFLPSDRSCGLGPQLRTRTAVADSCALAAVRAYLAVTAFAESFGAVRKHVIATIYAIATIYVIAILIAVVLVIVC